MLRRRLSLKIAESMIKRDSYKGQIYTGNTTSFPRGGDVENPWHIIDFSKFIEYAASRPKTDGPEWGGQKLPFAIGGDFVGGYITDKHFAPYYSLKPISPCNIQYDVIIKQEFLGDELGSRLQSVILRKYRGLSIRPKYLFLVQLQ